VLGAGGGTKGLRDRERVFEGVLKERVMGWMRGNILIECDAPLLIP